MDRKWTGIWIALALGIATVAIAPGAWTQEGGPLCVGEAPAWQSGGTENPDWCWGVATSGPVGTLGYGTNLDGDHAFRQCSYIESPAVPADLFALAPVLTFDHWYRTDASSNFAWHAGVLMVSADGGDSWTRVAHESQDRTAGFGLRNCLNDLHGHPTSPTYPGWGGTNPANPASDRVVVDLADFAGAGDVKVRFVFGTDGIQSASACPEADPCAGWYVRSAVLGPQPILP